MKRGRGETAFFRRKMTGAKNGISVRPPMLTGKDARRGGKKAAARLFGTRKARDFVSVEHWGNGRGKSSCPAPAV